MPKIILKSTKDDFTIEREYKSSDSIADMKKIISTHFNNSENITILYNGKVITDNVIVQSLSDEDLILDFIVDKPVTDDVEMNSIDKVCIEVHGKKKYVDRSKILKKDGKYYLIIKKEKKRNYAEELRNVFLLRADMVVKIAMILALYLTENRELATLLTGMLILRAFNNLRFKIKMKAEGFMFYMKCLIAYFLTMFMLNSDQILDFKSV